MSQSRLLALLEFTNSVVEMRGTWHTCCMTLACGCRDGTLYASTSGRSSQERSSGAWMRPPYHAPSDSIISLVPSATEILFALGLGHRCATAFHSSRPCSSFALLQLSLIHMRSLYIAPSNQDGLERVGFECMMFLTCSEGMEDDAPNQATGC